MGGDANRGAVARFYDNHPINEDQILGALAAKGITEHAIIEDHLKEFDQDHYGWMPRHRDRHYREPLPRREPSYKTCTAGAPG